MSAALAEPTEAIATHRRCTEHGTGRGQQSQRPASRGPTTPEGKPRSRENSCKDGLTGKGIVLPPDAAAEVDSPRAGVRPRLPAQGRRRARAGPPDGAGRPGGARCWASAIIQHDARMNAARFANWEQDEQLAAVELGHRLGDDPEAHGRPAPPQLRRLRLADRPLDAPGQRPLDRRRRRAGLHLDRCRPGAGAGPAGPAGGAAPPG